MFLSKQVNADNDNSINWCHNLVSAVVQYVEKFWLRFLTSNCFYYKIHIFKLY